MEMLKRPRLACDSGEVFCVREINPIVVGHRGWLLRRTFVVVFDNSGLRNAYRQENHCWQRFTGLKFVLEVDLLAQRRSSGNDRQKEEVAT
jgi:hypothetical protein